MKINLAIVLAVAVSAVSHAEPIRINLIGTNISKRLAEQSIKNKIGGNFGVVLNRRPQRNYINLRVNDTNSNLRHGTIGSVGTYETRVAPRNRMIEVIGWAFGCLPNDYRANCVSLANEQRQMYRYIEQDAKNYCASERKHDKQCFVKWLHGRRYKDMPLDPNTFYSFYIGCSFDQVMNAHGSEDCSVRMPQ